MTAALARAGRLDSGPEMDLTYDVVRISDVIGGDVLGRLYERGVALGPVWKTRARGVIEIVVPRGTAANWPHADTQWVECARPQRAQWPSPTGAGRSRWIAAPHDAGRPPVTDPDAVAEAVTAAIVRIRITRAALRLVSPAASVPHSGSEMNCRYSPLYLPAADLGSTRTAREHVRTTLDTWDLAEVSDVVLQVAHELVANALEHGAGEPWACSSRLKQTLSR